MKITATLQRLQFLKTVFGKLAKPLAKFRELPMVVRLGIGAALALALVVYVWMKTGSAGDVGILLGIIAFVGAGLWLISRSIRARANRMSNQFDSELAGTEMLEDLRQQWSRATSELKSAGVDRYNMSFYMLIGEPQSGKTTTLEKSGLNFPIGMDKIKGLGGTRNLDWWFTDEAVILDTAGRLTFQEERTSDAEEWNEFLGLLSRYRPRCPVNGVIVTIPCTSLLDDDARTREHKAGVIRRALVEIERGLGVQFPVFVLLTKADRIGGFTEFFEPLRALEQAQLFGWSRPKERFETPFQAAEIREAMGDMVSRLRRWRVLLLDQHGAEMAPEKRDRMVPFPEEFAAIEGALADYLEQIFPDSKLLDPLFLRGVYVTSGIQKGEPILKAAARIMGNVTGGGGDTLVKLGKGSERAYFIRDFYRKKVFAEPGLVVPTAARTRKVRLIQRLGYGAATAAALLGTIWVGYKWVSLKRAVETPVERVDALADAYGMAADEEGVSEDVLEAIERLGGLDEPLRKGADLREDGEGIMPRILRGELLGTSGFLKVGASQQSELHGGLVRSVRVGLVDGVLGPLAESSVNRLRELSEEDSGEPLSASLKLRRDGVRSLVEMMLEQDRADDQPAPESLDGYFALAMGRDPKSDVAQRAGRVFDLLRASHEPSMDDGIGGTNKKWKGLGLSAAVSPVASSLESVLPDALESIRRDALAACVPDGSPADWLDEAMVPAWDDKSGKYESETAVSERLRASGDDAPRLAGYLYLRAAAASLAINDAIAGCRVIEDELAAARSLGDARAVLEARGPEWLALYDRADRARKELGGIRQVIGARGAPYAFNDAVRASLRTTNEFFEGIAELAESRDADGRSWIRSLATGQDWTIGLDEEPIARAEQILGGERPSDWGSGDVKWTAIARLEALDGEEGEASHVLVLDEEGMAALDEFGTTAGLFGKAVERGAVLAWAGAVDDAGAVRPKAWGEDVDGPLKRLTDELSAALGEQPGGVRSILGQTILANALEDLGGALRADAFDIEGSVLRGSLLGPAAANPAPGVDRKDGYPTSDPAFARENLDAVLRTFVVPCAADIDAARTHDALAGFARGAGAAEALDGQAVGYLEAWCEYWQSTLLADLDTTIQELNAGDLSWGTVRESARGLFRGPGAVNWAKRLTSLRDRVAAGTVGDAAPLDETFGPGLNALPRTAALASELGEEQRAAEERGALIDGVAVTAFGKLFFDDLHVFGEGSSGSWRNELMTDAGRAELTRALTVFRGLQGTGEADGIAPGSPFDALDTQLSSLGEVARGAIARDLVDAMKGDYGRIVGTDVGEAFPFATLGDEEPDRRALDDVFGPEGLVRDMFALYGPLNLLPYVEPGARADARQPRDVEESPLFTAGDRPPLTYLRALSAMRDVSDLYFRIDGDGEAAPLELYAEFLERECDGTIFPSVVRLEVSTQTGGFRGGESDTLRYLRRRSGGKLLIEPRTQAFGLRFSRDIDDAEDPTLGVVLEGDRGEDLRGTLRRSGGLAFLQVVEELRLGAGGGRMAREYTPALGGENARTVLDVPMLVRHRPAEGDAREGRLTMRITATDVYVPALPLDLPDWR